MRKLSKKSKIAAIILLTTLFAGFFPAPALGLDWYTFINASPNPVGVGQQVLISFGMTMPSQVSSTFNGWIVTITDPNGAVKTLGPLNADATGGTYTLFTPDKVGNYTVQASYPGGNVTFPAFGIVPVTTYNVPPTNTTIFTFTVQQEPIPGFSESVPVPTDYWTYPIYGENRQWSTIADNWLMPGYDTVKSFAYPSSGAFSPYSRAPDSGHILWTRQMLFGGIIGGNRSDEGYYTGSSYRQELLPPVIIGGRLYYNVIDPPQQGFYCVDMYTGQTIWYQNQTFRSGTGTVVQGTQAQLDGGQILLYETPNQHGGNAYLWSTSSTTWARYDAWTGNLLNTLVNGTADSMITTAIGALPLVTDANGVLYTYVLDTTSKTLAMWNSSLVVTGERGQTQSLGLDWRKGIQWNVSVPTIPGLTFSVWDPKNPTVLIASNQSRGTPGAAQAFVDIAYSATDGHMLWNKTRNEGTWEAVIYGRAMADGIYSIYRKETRQLYAYSASTGDQLWVSDVRPNYWATYYTGSCFAYGNIYVISYDGMIYAYNETTGKINWIWSDNSVNPSGTETPYGDYSFYGGIVIADGKVFVTNQEHSANSPLYRGEKMYAVDAYNGTYLWSINGWYQQPAIGAGGYLIAPNQQDGLLYCFGKGPSVTTVSVSPKTLTQGDNVVIEGMVTDQSPGQMGTPAVSEESMSLWMEHIHMQKPTPTNTTGVIVSLNVIDANNNFRNIGSATTDISGSFSYIWKPDIPGKYTIIASFAGSPSYGSSSAETAFNAAIPPSASPVATSAPASFVETYFVPAVIAIIVAIAIATIIIVLTLRKRL